MSEEMIDVLDAQGVPTGQVRSKKEVHQLGLWHRTVHVWIVTPTGNLLMQRRGPNMDTHPNHWDISSAGHISAGETSLQGVQREMSEELGLSISEQPELLGTVHGESVHQSGRYINREYQDVYLMTRNVSIDELTKQESEVSALRLMPWLVVQSHIAAKDPEFVSHDQEYQLLFSVLQQRFP
jgi:isopentenyldiphosphate isomerase